MLYLEVRSMCVQVCLHVIVAPITDTLQWTHPAGEAADPLM